MYKVHSNAGPVYLMTNFVRTTIIKKWGHPTFFSIHPTLLPFCIKDHSNVTSNMARLKTTFLRTFFVVHCEKV